MKCSTNVTGIATRHRGQTMHYLLHFDTPHAKLINDRAERIAQPVSVAEAEGHLHDQ